MIETERKSDMSPIEVSHELGISREAVYKLFHANKLKHYRTSGPGRGNYRVTREALDAFKEQSLTHSS